MKQEGIQIGPRITEQIGRVFGLFPRRYMVLTPRFVIWQWPIAGAIGLLLGLYILVVSSLFSVTGVLLAVLIVICPFAVMAIGHTRKLLLAVILLEIPIQIDLNLYFQEKVSDLNAIAGFNISLTTLCLGILYSWWLAELLVKRDELPPSAYFRLVVPSLIYLAMDILSLGVASIPIRSAFELNQLMQALLLYFYIAQAIRTRQDVHFTVTFLLMGLALQGLVMIGLRGIGHDIDVGVISARIDPSTRVGGTIGSPNAAASYMALVLNLTLGFLLTPLERWYKWLAWVAAGLGGIGLFLTLSRGAWLGCAVSVTLICFFAWRRGWLSLKLPVAFSVFAGVIFAIFYDVILARLTGIDDENAAYSRWPLIKLAARMIEDHWLLGVGVNNFAANLRHYVTPEFSNQWITTVHNRYLLIWAETGIGGLAAFIWFLLATIKQGWQVWQRQDRFLSPIALSLAAAIVGQMIHMNVALFNGRVQMQMLWLFAGLITAMYLMDGGRS